MTSPCGDLHFPKAFTSCEEPFKNEKEIPSEELTRVIRKATFFEPQGNKLDDFIIKLNTALADVDLIKEDEDKAAMFVVKKYPDKVTIELLNCTEEFFQEYYGLKSEIDDQFVKDFLDNLDDRGYSFAIELKEQYGITDCVNICDQNVTKSCNSFYDNSINSIKRNNFSCVDALNDVEKAINIQRKEKLSEIVVFLKHLNMTGGFSDFKIKNIDFDFKNHELYLHFITIEDIQISNFLIINIDEFYTVGELAAIIRNRLKEMGIDSFGIELTNEKSIKSPEEMFFLNPERDGSSFFCETEEVNPYLYVRGIDPDNVDFTKPNEFCNFNLNEVVKEISFVLSSLEDVFLDNLSFGVVNEKLCFRFGEENYFLEIGPYENISVSIFIQLFCSAISNTYQMDVTDLLSLICYPY